MKKFDKNMYFYIFLLCLSIIILSFQVATETRIFNAQQAYSYVKELSSPLYQGRKAGTEGNIKALNFAEDILKESGYDVIRQSFNAIVPFLEETPVLELQDEHGVVLNSFEHRKDFRETLAGYSKDGEAITKFIIDGKSTYDIKGKIFENSIVIVNNDYNHRAEQDQIYIKAKVKAILVPSSANLISKASGYPGYNKNSFLNIAMRISFYKNA